MIRVYRLGDRGAPEGEPREVKEHTRAVYSVAFDVSGKVLLTAGDDRTIRVQVTD